MGSAFQRSALITAGKLTIVDRKTTLAALRKLCGPDLGDLVRMVDEGVLQVGQLKSGEMVMWLTVEPEDIRIS